MATKKNGDCSMPFCPNCGKSIGEEDRFCSACGYKLPQLAHRPVDRPVEIEYLIPLHTLQSFSILVWLWLVIGYSHRFSPVPVLEVMSFGLSIVSIGIVVRVLAYGYRRRRRWAWNLGIMFSLLEIVPFFHYVVNSLSMGLALVIMDWRALLSIFVFLLSPSNPTFFTIVVGPIIIYYLTRPRVKQYFGKESRKEHDQPSKVTSDV